VVEVAIGVAAAFLLPRSGRERCLTVLGAAAVTAVASVIFAMLQATYTGLFSPVV
jgi:hypothetical protein